VLYVLVNSVKWKVTLFSTVLCVATVTNLELSGRSEERYYSVCNGNECEEVCVYSTFLCLLSVFFSDAIAFRTLLRLTVTVSNNVCFRPFWRHILARQLISVLCDDHFYACW
jgi:RsiW-degrading membrane proteinase PrsW (M82 family)